MNQSLSDETHDVETDVPDRILQMRRLKKRPRDDGRTYLGADPRLFYIQGCFMAEYEDHYAEYYEPLFDSQPTYEALSIKQLRCYFTWRAAIRSRRASGTGIYYIYLYLFELINNIGVAGSLEALERMAFVINTYRNIFAGSVPLFKTWFRDYYALNNVDKPFSELVRGLGLSDVFPVETYEDEFEYIYTLRIGDFDITGDPFIADFGFLGFARCYNAVMKNLKLLFNMYGFDIDSLFKGAFNTDNTWFPYDRAIFCDTAVSNDRVLRFSAHEQYVCVR
ncbi:MAG: TerB N-terminal domain-containing protein, partial [Clostridiales bacterium]|nr:TerB N-terminal domain-containing protein [Clostridiales bacterium]